MAVSDSYRDFVLEQLGRVTSVTGKSMFGGVGLYAAKMALSAVVKKTSVQRSSIARYAF